MITTQVIQKIFTDEWNQILEEIAEFRRNSKTKWIWFRGHGDESFNLESGLFRIRKDKNRLPLTEYKSIEKHMFVAFKSQAATFIKEDERDIWFFMQHHGLKTRLLDWTESFATALYFAFNDWDYENNNEACIWLLDPHALNLYLHGDSPIYTTKVLDSYQAKHLPFLFGAESRWKGERGFRNNSFAIYPSKNTPRLLSQRGFFTVQSNQLVDLETELNHKCPNEKERILKKIILSSDLVENVYEYLTINGINEFSIFNDIDGLCKSLNKDFAEYTFNQKLKHIAKHASSPQ
ncbi:FRG domain-containing protein [Bacillus bombysepticus]